MSKAVMISIQPKWCELIARGKKTIEVRKTAPKIPTPFKCYIYMTKNGNKPIKVIESKKGIACIETDYKMAGKVIGEFECDYIDEFACDSRAHRKLSEWGSCLTEQEIRDYCNGQDLYGWHISNLVIYDKPKDLGWFRKPCKVPAKIPCSGCGYASTYMDKCERPCIDQPFQSWGYVVEV